MKRTMIILVLSTALAASPAMADHKPGLLTKENVGGAIGATVGGLLGAQVGHGDGQLAATAVGAVGGYIVGRDVGHNYYGGRRHYGAGKTYGRTHRSHRPRLHPIHETYMAKCTSNVRAGPGTRFRIVDRLHNRERVRVIGKVRGRNWYMVRTRHGRGFVYAPLLRPARYGHRSYRDAGRGDRGRGGWRGDWHR